jgi:putative endonuclease
VKNWFIYVVRCRDGSLYTGITTDIERRINEHNNAASAAAYTRSRRPVVLVYHECVNTRSAALRREAQIKTMEKRDKEIMIAGARHP